MHFVDEMRFVARQCFLVAVHTFEAPVAKFDQRFAGEFLRHDFTVQEQAAAAHGDPVTRKPDDALDIVDLEIIRLPENNHIPPFWHAAPKPLFGRGTKIEWQRIAAIAMPRYFDATR